MEIPRLGQRIQCFMFTRTFASAMQQARPLISPPYHNLAWRNTKMLLVVFNIYLLGHVPMPPKDVPASRSSRHAHALHLNISFA